MEENLISCFCLKESILYKKIEENFKGMYIKINCKSIISPDELNIKKTILNLRDRDRLRISLKIKEDEDDYDIVNYSTGYSISDFTKNITELLDLADDNSNFELNIDIVKEQKNNLISIYNFKEFLRFLDNLSLKNILGEISVFLLEGNLKLDIVDENQNINANSKSILLKKLEDDNVNFEYKDRLKDIENISEICNFIDLSNYRLLYTDFKLNKLTNTNLDNIFQRLEYIFSLIAICDRSELFGENIIKLSIHGHKTINLELDYMNIDLSKDLKQFTKICEWIYKEDSGDINDKIGIVRNIVSISILDEKNIDVSKNLLASIKSSHEIYLKENVEKYLQVKQEVSGSLFELMNNVSGIAETVGNRLKTNLVGIVTFFVTIVIANSLDDNRLKNIFTKDITMISIFFIAISIIYLILSKKDSYEELERFKLIYNRLKSNYNGILNEDDIEKIFHHDEYLNEDVEFIQKKIQRDIRAWIIILVIIFIFINIVGDFKFEYLYENFVKGYKGSIKPYIEWIVSNLNK